MKTNNILKMILGLLIILAISLIGFIGIYTKGEVGYENQLPDYKLGMSLVGKRVINLSVSEDTKEVIYDESGNKVNEIPANADESKYKKEQIKVNAQEILTEENYKKSEQIIKNRLDKYKVEEYETRLNKEDGTIEISLLEDDNTDTILPYLSYQGKFEIYDSETEEILLDSTKIEGATVQYVNGDDGTTIFLSVQYNRESKDKLKEISQTYIKTTNEEGKETTKKVVIKLDDEKLTETYFGYTITDGNLKLTVGSATSSSSDLQDYIAQASGIAVSIDSGKMPIKYKTTDNRFIQTDITKEKINIVIYAIIGIIVIISIYYMIRYKKHGFFGALSFVGWIALISLAFRYTDIIIGIEAIVAILILILLNSILVNSILKSAINNTENIIGIAYLKTVDIFVVLLGMFIIFSFISWQPINIIGIIGFWGTAITAIYNATVTNILVTSQKRKN